MSEFQEDIDFRYKESKRRAEARHGQKKPSGWVPFLMTVAFTLAAVILVLLFVVKVHG